MVIRHSSFVIFSVMRLPLYSKILLWFFLNLLVLGIAALVALSFQFSLGPELLVAGAAGERVQSLAGAVRDEVNRQPRPEWNEILERFSTNYRVRLMLYRHDGTRLAGDTQPLPPEVHARVNEMRAPGPRRGPTGREGPGQEFRGPPERRDRPPDVRDRPAPLNNIHFVARTSEPRRYWIGVAMPLAEFPPGRVPGMLIISTDSVRAGGLLLDFSLWLWIGAGAVVFSVLFWLPLVGGITRALAQMNFATAQIAEGRFDARVSERRRDELGSLGAAINRMAARLAGFVSGQKRFTGDIAHELCAPIARMQMAVGILEERAEAKDRQYVEDLREEVQHMSNLVNELLSFSKASLGAGTARLQTMPLRPLIEKAVKRETRDGAELVNEVPGELAATVDPELIVRAVSNLLRNAVRYAGDAGPITVTARALDGEVELIVADRGPGVPEMELPRLFDPFYRVDTSRARETGGVGLGLSIVKTCVQSCHGAVTCRNREGGGFEVVLRLPG
jgi:two-component system, OmpR family, sensor histidine kinase CpxA